MIAGISVVKFILTSAKREEEVISNCFFSSGLAESYFPIYTNINLVLGPETQWYFLFLSSSPIVRLLNPIPEYGKSLLLQSAIQLKESTILLTTGIRNLVPGIGNPEFPAWNSESKTVLNYTT